MFTEEVTSAKAQEFSRLIGTQLVSSQTLTPTIDRAEYFSAFRGEGNLFLDPDTGVSLRRLSGAKSVHFVFGEELVEWSRERPEALTLVFDQSYSRNVKKEVAIQEKLKYFAKVGISGIIYDSHATFLLLGANEELVARARKCLLEVSGLPEGRLVGLKRTLIDGRASAPYPVATAPGTDLTGQEGRRQKTLRTKELTNAAKESTEETLSQSLVSRDGAGQGWIID
jgi:hypothetical protein